MPKRTDKMDKGGPAGWTTRSSVDDPTPSHAQGVWDVTRQHVFLFLCLPSSRCPFPPLFWCLSSMQEDLASMGSHHCSGTWDSAYARTAAGSCQLSCAAEPITVPRRDCAAARGWNPGKRSEPGPPSPPTATGRGATSWLTGAGPGRPTVKIGSGSLAIDHQI